MLDPHLWVLECIPQLSTEHLDLIDLPPIGVLPDAECHAFEVVKKLDQVEGSYFFL